MSFMKRILPAIFGAEIPVVDVKTGPTLGKLAYALRHPATWPKGFWWDYDDCRHCAVALSFSIWPMTMGDYASDYLTQDQDSRFYQAAVARGFSIPHADAGDIFFKVGTNGVDDNANRKSVTPEMVADHIDAYLAKKNAEIALPLMIGTDL